MTSVFTVYGMDVFTRETWDIGSHSDRSDADSAADALNAIVGSARLSIQKWSGEGPEQKAAREALVCSGDLHEGGPDLRTAQYGVRSHPSPPELILVTGRKGQTYPKAIFHTFEAAQDFANKVLVGHHGRTGMASAVRVHPCGRGRDFVRVRTTPIGAVEANFVWLKDPRA